MTEFTTKDSGKHEQFESGMRRDTQEGKPRFALMMTKLQPYEEQMLTRYAALLARGAEKYEDRNWEDGDSEEELERAKDSLLRHTMQLVTGETDEDHAAAVWFNTQAIEYFRWRIEQKKQAGTLTLAFDGSASGDHMFAFETLWGGQVVVRGDLKTGEGHVVPPSDVTKAQKIEVTPEPCACAGWPTAGRNVEDPDPDCKATDEKPRTVADYLPPKAEEIALTPELRDHLNGPPAPPAAFVDEGAQARAKHRRNLQEWHNRPVTEPKSGLSPEELQRRLAEGYYPGVSKETHERLAQKRADLIDRAVAGTVWVTADDLKPAGEPKAPLDSEC